MTITPISFIFVVGLASGAGFFLCECFHILYDYLSRKKAKNFSITPEQVEILRFGILLVENECVNSYRKNGDEFSKLQDDEAVKLRRLFNQVAGAGCSSAIIKVRK